MCIRDRVRDGAHGDNQQNMRALDALAENEGVLRPDGDDEGEPAGQARNEGKDHVIHGKGGKNMKPVNKPWLT